MGFLDNRYYRKEADQQHVTWKIRATETQRGESSGLAGAVRKGSKTQREPDKLPQPGDQG